MEKVNLNGGMGFKTNWWGKGISGKDSRFRSLRAIGGKSHTKSILWKK